MLEEFSSRYDFKESEDRIYALWDKSGFFNPDNLLLPATYNLQPTTFSIVMPPPNANGALHMGHAMYGIQDIMIRFNRLRGKRTLWLPGMDHAGFETQAVFEKKLEKEGRNRFQIPREELYREMMDFTLENKKIVEHQFRKLGVSCDWSRKKFTLDPGIVEQVQKTFIKMYKDGLIYRDERLVNWCLKHQTALSDLEVKHIEQKDPLYYMKYGPFTLATVRPETKFGDTALAVNPKDKRYKNYIGKEIEAEGLLGKFKIKVIADEAVDMKFGTGVVKVTPAHDFNDYEMSLRHNLERKQVIDRFGRLNGLTGPYSGMKIEEARKRIADDLQARGLMEKIDDGYTHSVAVCYKCGRQLEPLLLPQWWVKMKPLATPAIKAVENGEIKYYPDRFRKITLHWLKNIRDWNISRQIVWGIQIPAWFCPNSELTARNSQLITKKECSPIISMEKPEKCGECGNKNMTQDPDVFDTWFSSGQWPYLTLGYKDGETESQDMKNFYPTDVMETAGDIIFFWVARMIMLGIYRAGKIPFRKVYLHGLVCDKDKKKMSKSKGNVIDPLGVASEYGMDAVRMALIAGNTPGQDTAISEDKIRGYRNFTTKLWNIARFVFTQMDKFKNEDKGGALPFFDEKEAIALLIPDDKKVLENIATLKKQITKDIEFFKFYGAFEKLYHYIWHEFADKIIEEAKLCLESGDEKEKKSALVLLGLILKECLLMLHPFAPFVTEEIYQNFLKIAGGKKSGKLLMTERWK